jgi:hypothetical protein
MRTVGGQELEVWDGPTVWPCLDPAFDQGDLVRNLDPRLPDLAHRYKRRCEHVWPEECSPWWSMGGNKMVAAAFRDHAE